MRYNSFVSATARSGTIAASGNLQSSIRNIYLKIRRETRGVPLRIFGGDEENRTPVRKPLDITFFVGSLLFRFPLGDREQTRYSLG